MHNQMQRPAKFLMINSKGKPDFIFTLLTIFSFILIFLIIFWAAFNLLAFFHTLNNTNSQNMIDLLKNYNENMRYIFITFVVQVLGLAGTYYKRRSQQEKGNGKANEGESPGSASLWPSILADKGLNFVSEKTSTLTHPNYDDEEEDI